MKIKVSKKFADFINKTAKELGFEAEAEVVSMTERGYVLNVAGFDGVFDAQDFGDYDWANDEYKAIRISYPYEYYAMPKYLTSKMLHDERARRHADTEREIKEMIRELCEI